MVCQRHASRHCQCLLSNDQASTLKPHRLYISHQSSIGFQGDHFDTVAYDCFEPQLNCTELKYYTGAASHPASYGCNSDLPLPSFGSRGHTPPSERTLSDGVWDSDSEGFGGRNCHSIRTPALHPPLKITNNWTMEQLNPTATAPPVQPASPRAEITDDGRHLFNNICQINT